MSDRSIAAPAHVPALIASRPEWLRHVATGVLAVIIALAFAGCNGEEPQPNGAAAPADTQVHTMEGMPGMSEMPGMQDDMSAMMGHMQRMRATGPDSMQAMLPMHRQMVANMIAQMNREMREMNMTADASWNATVDSLRSDLTRMPEMGGRELQELMPGHQDRMMRLMEMHRTMMAEMQ